jgi:hypothetical protein
VSPETATAALDTAIKDAGLAQQRFLGLEHQALTADEDDRPTGAQVIAAQHEAELATRRVDVARERLERAREEARVAGLRTVGTDIDQLAADAETPNAEQVASLQQIAEGAAAIRAQADAHDKRVAELYHRAADLYGGNADPVKRSGQAGPWAAHMPPMGVRHGNTHVHIIGGAADTAIAAAVQGDIDGALSLLSGAEDCTPPQPDYYLKDTLPQFGIGMPVYGHPDRATAEMLRSGRFVRMTPEEVEQWQANRR